MMQYAVAWLRACDAPAHLGAAVALAEHPPLASSGLGTICVLDLVECSTWQEG